MIELQDVADLYVSIQETENHFPSKFHETNCREYTLQGTQYSFSESLSTSFLMIYATQLNFILQKIRSAPNISLVNSKCTLGAY